MNNDNKAKLVIVQRIFPHYRRAIFAALASKYSLSLLHGADNGNIPQVTDFFSVPSKNYYFPKVTYQANLLSILRVKPSVLIQEFSLSFLNLYLSYVLSKIYGFKFILWGHGYDRANGFKPAERFSDKIRLYFIKKADACILYSDEVKLELQDIAPNQKFTVARNSIDSAEKEEIYKKLSFNGKNRDAALRLCFVARLSENKKVVLLSAIAALLKQKSIPFLITVVGDGEYKEVLEQQCKHDGVFECFEFLGPLYEEEQVAKIIFSSDFMLIPAWCGLSVNHAFCYATPLATLSNQQHPPEIQFARNGYNAVLADSIEQLVQHLVDIKSDCKKIEMMSNNARIFYQQQLSISAMLKGFTDAITEN